MQVLCQKDRKKKENFVKEKNGERSEGGSRQYHYGSKGAEEVRMVIFHRHTPEIDIAGLSNINFEQD